MLNILNKIALNAAPYLQTAGRTRAANVGESITNVAQRALESFGNTQGLSQAITDSAVRAMATTSTSSNNSLIGPVLFASSVAAGLLFKKSQQQATEVVSADSDSPRNDLRGFTNSVKSFLNQIESQRGISLASYKTFINSMNSRYPDLSLDEMNTIAVDEFNKKLTSEQKAALIAQFTDHSVIDQEAIERKDRLDQAKQTLLDKESELAGPRRFNGTINDAWKNYFNAKKEFLKDLSPLCRLIKHKEPRLSDHEKNVLRSVKPAAAPVKKNELQK